MHAFTNPLTARIADFLCSIGVEVRAGETPPECFLPGVHIAGGALVVDEASLLHPGDLLHEAGHIALTPGERRAELDGDVGSDLGEEIGAIAWSYAALRHLELDPAIVFHPHGYRGAAQGFIDNFQAGRYVGVPLLQWMGLAFEAKNAAQAGVPPYPHMVRWLRE